MTRHEKITGRYFTFFENFQNNIVIVEMESEDMDGLNGWAKVDVETELDKLGSRQTSLDILEIKVWMGDKPINVMPEHENIFKQAILDYYI